MSCLIRRVSCFALLSALAACSDNNSSSPGEGDDASQSGSASGSGSGSSTGSGSGSISGSSTGSGTTGSSTGTGSTGSSTGDTDAAGDASVADATMTGPDAADAGPAASEAGVDASVPGLLLHYAFDEGSGTVVDDTSGSMHNGTLEIATADAGADAAPPGTGWTTSGRTNGAAAFTGAQDVTVPSGVFTNVTDATITAWVKLAAYNSWSRIFDLGNGPIGVGNRWTFLTASAGANGPIEWNVYGGVPGDGSTREAVLAPGTQLPLGVWKHIAVTETGSTYRMYIDGFPAADLANGPVIPMSEMEPLGGASWLGKSRFASVGDQPLDATVDEMQVYNRVLSASEVENLAWPQHDYSSWHFDEGTGTTATDSSDNAITGTLFGSATWVTDGRLGAALDLSGGTPSADGGDLPLPHVELASNPLHACATAFTISAWVKVHTVVDWARIFDFGTDTSTFTYLTPEDNNGVLHFGMVAPAGIFDLPATTGVPADGAWHHVAVTVGASGAVAIYLDGASVATGTSASVGPSSFTTVATAYLGRSHFPVDPYLNAGIDELRISCRAYTSDEIKNLAHGP
jgi:hypothetical protein